MNTDEQARYVLAALLENPPNWRRAAHAHPEEHELIVVLRGRMRARIAGQTLEASPGSLLFYPAGLEHQEDGDPADPVEVMLISFRCPGLTLEHVAFHTQDTLGRVRELGAWLIAERWHPSAITERVKQSLLDAIVTELLRLNTVSEPPMVVAVRTYMRKHLDRQIGLADLAREAGMSKYHFLRIYRAAAGHTPMEDLRLLRIETARALLLTTSIPLKDVALRVGFRDEFQLSRVFRRCLGASPGAFRQNRFRGKDGKR